MSAETVTVGVPVFRGEHFLADTLRSIQSQTHEDLVVLISIDGPDAASEAACRPFLDDPRFRLVVQPDRRGWADNINWLLARVETPFWCYQQQDDVIDARYLETLVAHARRERGAAVVYCDIQAFGSADWVSHQISVRGTPAARMLHFLHGQLIGWAFRGLTRRDAIERWGGIPHVEPEDFLSDVVWNARMAASGDLVRVPEVLYRKRYHTGSVHDRWSTWPVEKRVRGWIAHCEALLSPAMAVPATTPERRLLWMAAVTRLAAPIAEHYVPLGRLTAAQRRAMLDGFLDLAKARRDPAVSNWLEAPWPDVEDWTREAFWVPSDMRRRLDRAGGMAKAATSAKAWRHRLRR